MENKLKKPRKCACCDHPPFIDGMQMRILTFTESGEPIFPYENEEESMSVMLPVCDYHMVLAGEGWIFYDQNKGMPVQPKILTILETKSDGELKVEQMKLKRMPKNEKNKMMAAMIKDVLTARQWVTTMASGQSKSENPVTNEIRKCKICGCTDDVACPGGCRWIEIDLCSKCAEKKSK